MPSEGLGSRGPRGRAPLTPALEDLSRLGLERLARVRERSFLSEVRERAEAASARFTPLTVADRLDMFQRMGYRPHGVYLPASAALREEVLRELREIGDIESVDERLRRYYDLQSRGEEMERRGVPGAWNGQQAVARSPAQFRIVAFGRRAGKTYHAAREALAVMMARPRSVVWCAAPSMGLVGRCFDMVDQLVADLGLRVATRRNNDKERLIVLSNGSRCEGITLENNISPAGLAVDFVVVDEAANIRPEAWYRAVYPTLADRQGQALLISSWEGTDNFFFQQAERAREEAARSGDSSVWAVFQDASWEVNFYQFPQGRRSKMIRIAERMLPPTDFLEQFGAIPARVRGQVFPEFKERVHVVTDKDLPARCKRGFDPSLPVICSVDPSGGANPYAIVAVQKHENFCVVIDEFYERAVTVEDISPILKRRPWARNVQEVIIDSAYPIEIERWLELGWPAYAVPNKPKVSERLPLYRNLLRHPTAFRGLYQRKVAEVMAEMGMSPEEAEDNLSPADLKLIYIQVEEKLSDRNITEEDLQALRDCSRIFFYGPTCYNTIREHKLYRHQERTRKNAKEDPMDAHNHALDALGYFAWVHYRTLPDMAELVPRATQHTTLSVVGGEMAAHDKKDEDDERPQPVSYAERLRAAAGPLAAALPGTPLQKSTLRPARGWLLSMSRGRA